MKQIKIEKFHQLSLMLEESKMEVIFVTTDSIGLKPILQLNKNENYHCAVRVLDKLCDITICPISIQDSFVEAKVMTSCDIYRQFIQEYFHAELFGMGLKKIPKEKILKTEQGVPHWYYGDTEHEIYFITSDKGVINFQISYQGEVVSYNEDEGITLGSLDEETHSEKILHKGAHLVSQKNKFSKEIMECLSRFIEICPDMDLKFKHQILKVVDDRFKKDWA